MLIAIVIKGGRCYPEDSAGFYPEEFITLPTIRKDWEALPGRFCRPPALPGRELPDRYGEGEMMSEQMVTESDGIARPWWMPTASTRPQHQYVDMGRVVAGGRVYRVIVRGNGSTTRDVLIGHHLVTDDGTVYTSPDEITAERPAYHRLRWVGGFGRSKAEANAYLMGHRHAGADWWARAGAE